MLSAVSTSPGPTIDVTGWVAWIIIAGAVSAALLAIATVYIKVIQPVLDGMSTLSDIAVAFQPNGHPSLPQQVEQMHRSIDRNGVMLVRLHDYTHNNMHALRNGMATLVGSEATASRLTAVMGDMVTAMKDISQRDKGSG